MIDKQAQDALTIGVLGPVIAQMSGGQALTVGGRRHREVLALLVAARGRVVTLGSLVDALWPDPPKRPVQSIRTFVSELRHNLDPGRGSAASASAIVTVHDGYALRVGNDQVDAWRFESAVRESADAAAQRALALLDGAMALWRGEEPYAGIDLSDAVTLDRDRLLELHALAVERRCSALLRLGRAADAVLELQRQVELWPLREESWRLLALALEGSSRHAEAAAVLRRARVQLADRQGRDPGRAIREGETLLGHRHDTADRAALPPVEGAWTATASAYDRAVSPSSAGRLETTMALLRDLALTGGPGLEAVRANRVDAIVAAEAVADEEFVGRVISAFDVPSVWSRSDDPAESAYIEAAAERVLTALPPERRHDRARLLIAIAIESRGRRTARGREAALEAEVLARDLGDPALLASALGARHLHSFSRCGLARERNDLGAEIVALADRAGSATLEILGRLIRLQALSALADFEQADREADRLNALGSRYERPAVHMFTAWYRACRLSATGGSIVACDAAARSAAELLAQSAIPGIGSRMLPLAHLGVRIGRAAGLTDLPPDADWGASEPWVRPLLLITEGRRDRAAQALRTVPEPPPDHLLELHWLLLGIAAEQAGDASMVLRAERALIPAQQELAGAGTGMVSAGRVGEHLRRFRAFAEQTETGAEAEQAAGAEQPGGGGPF